VVGLGGRTTTQKESSSERRIQSVFIGSGEKNGRIAEQGASAFGIVGETVGGGLARIGLWFPDSLWTGKIELPATVLAE